MRGKRTTSSPYLPSDLMLVYKQPESTCAILASNAQTTSWCSGIHEDRRSASIRADDGVENAWSRNKHLTPSMNWPTEHGNSYMLLHTLSTYLPSSVDKGVP